MFSDLSTVDSYFYVKINHQKIISLVDMVHMGVKNCTHYQPGKFRFKEGFDKIILSVVPCGTTWTEEPETRRVEIIQY